MSEREYLRDAPGAVGRLVDVLGSEVVVVDRAVEGGALVVQPLAGAVRDCPRKGPSTRLATGRDARPGCESLRSSWV